jgi:ribonuclease HII
LKGPRSSLVAGIDEAGRGPVIGPMVMAIVACETEDSLRELGAKDSKLLTHEERMRLRDRLLEHPELYPHDLIALTPAEIDDAVSRKGLNLLEASTSAALILSLARRVPLREVIIDSPTRSTNKYESDVRAALSRIDERGVTRGIALRCEIRADANHPVVGAASIIAKTTRDAAIAEITARVGVPIGTGYPSDPLTQEYLAAHWQEPHDFFRKSWESYKRLTQGKQPTLADFGAQALSHAAVVAEFEALREHGFSFVPPTNQYEVVRLKNDAGVTVIRYTTKKLVVQGPANEKARTEELLARLNLLQRDAPADSKRGRPRQRGH